MELATDAKASTSQLKMLRLGWSFDFGSFYKIRRNSTGKRAVVAERYLWGSKRPTSSERFPMTIDGLNAAYDQIREWSRNHPK